MIFRQLNIFILLGQCILFYNPRILVSALIGQNVRRAQHNEFPSIVTFLKRIGGSILPDRDIICGGALISNQDVLTAEHCIQGEDINGVLISVGSNNIYSALRFYPAWWITYDQWRQQINRRILMAWNDVAIIRLTNAVPNEIAWGTVSALRPRRLYGEQVQFAGWGFTANGTTSVDLLIGSLVVLTKDECAARISALANDDVPVDKRLICAAAEPYVLMQQGDSGGPLFYQGGLVGISTGTCPFPEDYFHPNKVNIFFSAEYYRNFIDFILNVG